MKTLIGFLGLAALFLAGCSKDNGSQAAQATPPAPTNSSAQPTVIITNVPNTDTSATIFTNANSTNPAMAPVSYLGAVGKGRETAIKEIDVAQINQAIQVFNVEHDRYPKDLQELVDSGDLKEIPRPPYGLVLLYDPNTGQVSFARR